MGVCVGVGVGVGVGVCIPAFIAIMIRLNLLGVPSRSLEVCLFDGEKPITASKVPCRPYIIQTSVSFYKFKEGNNHQHS